MSLSPGARVFTSCAEIGHERSVELSETKGEWVLKAGQESQKIVVVEDEIEVAQTVVRALEQSGFSTEHFIRGRDLRRFLDRETPALCIIDLGLPDGDGLDLVRSLQREHDMAVIILTGRGDATDRVVGLELGADDYMVKPFEPRELVARVRAVLRRFGRQIDSVAPDQASPEARFHGWIFNPDSHALIDPTGQEVPISAAEVQLLLVLLKAPNRVLSREQLLEMASGGSYSPFDRSIDVRISRLRQKIEVDSRDPKIIKTVYGAGYLFAGQVGWSEGS